MNSNSPIQRPTAPIPFRWDPSRREQLGRILEGPAAESYPEFVADLRRCCARVVAAAGDSDLVFVGRSPESLFDYLTGALRVTSHASRLTLVNLSLRLSPPRQVRRDYPGAIDAVRAHLDALGLSPRAVASRPRPLAFVDLIYTGATLGGLVDLLLDWAGDAGVDEKAVLRRLRFVGITWTKKPSPNAERWKTQCAWVRRFRPSAVSSVSVPYHLWTYLGDYQPTVARTNPPSRWADDAVSRPPRAEHHLAAVRFAARIAALAGEREERLALASELASQRAMRFDWFRSLVTELRIARASRRPTRRRVRARTGLQARGVRCGGGRV